jgi:ribosomal protein S3AE
MAERKKYIDVQIPILGETTRVLGTPENLHNKTIKLDLTRKLRGKGLTITLRIFNMEGKLIAIPNQLQLTTSYIRRMMRKRTDYVEDSFQARCSDVRVTVKPLLITRKKVSRAVRRNLRNVAREFLLDYMKEKEYLEIYNEILDGTIQKTMLPKLKKVYPLSFSDIRIFETKELEKIDLEKASTTPVKEEEITDDLAEDETQEETKEVIEETIKKEEAVEETN